jgi:hypothetical protein
VFVSFSAAALESDIRRRGQDEAELDTLKSKSIAEAVEKAGGHSDRFTERDWTE